MFTDYQKTLDDMQKKFLMASDDTMCECPSCHNVFVTEQGDIHINPNQVEKGLDGKPLTREAAFHKAKFRYRCTSV